MLRVNECLVCNSDPRHPEIRPIDESVKSYTLVMFILNLARYVWFIQRYDLIGSPIFNFIDFSLRIDGHRHRVNITRD